MDAFLAFGGIGLGAILTWLASAYGARKEADREHAQWLRNRRHEAWANLVAANTALAMLYRRDIGIGDGKQLSDERRALVLESMFEAKRLSSEVSTLAAHVTLLGPDSIAESAAALTRSATAILGAHETTEIHRAAREELLSSVVDFVSEARMQLKPAVEDRDEQSKLAQMVGRLRRRR